MTETTRWPVGTLLRAKESMDVSLDTGEIVTLAEGATAFVAEVFGPVNLEWEADGTHELVHLPNGERSRWDEVDMEAWHACSAP